MTVDLDSMPMINDGYYAAKDDCWQNLHPPMCASVAGHGVFMGVSSTQSRLAKDAPRH